jgi:hypothetical protein
VPKPLGRVTIPIRRSAWRDCLENAVTHPFAPSFVGSVLIMALVVVVYKLFRRSVRVSDSERFSHPKLDGTWRDWVS